MYPVTRTVAENFKQNAVQYLSILVNPVTGSSFELTDADVLANGLNINRYSANGNSVVLGSCVAAELTLEIENTDGRFNSVQFEGAQLTVSVGTQDGDNVGWVPMGLFTVDTAPRKLDTLSITALDGMVLFDKPINLDALSLPAQVKNIVRACCNECNIVIDTDLDALPNSSYVVNSVGDTEDLTYRQILVWCCQLMGVCGFMDWQGHLELSWYKKDGIPETVSGSIATFESVTNVPVSQLIVNIEPIQDLNGYDHPWVGGAGKNKFNVGSPQTITENGITWVVKEDGSITATGTATRDTYLVIVSESNLTAGSYIYTGNPSGSSSSTYRTMFRWDVNGTWSSWSYSNGTSATVTIPNTTKVNMRFTVSNGQTVSNIVWKPMLRLETESDATFAPYENVCPIYPSNGKNLFSGTLVNGQIGSNGGYSSSTSRLTNVTASNVLGDFLKAGTYTISAQAVTSATSLTQCTVLTKDSSLNIIDNFAASWHDLPFTFTLSSDGYICFTLRPSTGNVTPSNYVAQVEHGSIATTYVPYNAIGITRTGANIWDEEWELGGLSSTTGLPYSSNTLIRSKNYQKCLPSTKYYGYRGGTTGDVGLFWYDENLKFIRSNSVVNRTITSPENAYYFKVAPNFAYGTEYRNDISINYPSSVQTYEPYQGERYYPISDNPVYGGTLDVTTGVLTVNTRFVTINGNTSIGMEASTWNPNAHVFYFSLSGNKGKFGGVPNIVSNVGQTVSYSTLKNTSLPWLFSFTGSGSYLDWSAPFTSVADMKAFLNTTPIEAAYELDVPYTVQLTPTQVELLKGTNNIWADNSTLSVTFPAVTEITPAYRFSSDIYENPITITGVSVKGEENEALFGSDEYALLIEGNELITDDDVETIADNLAGLVGFSYYPFQASTLPMPYLYPLDIVAVQYKGQWYDGALTEVSFTASNATDMKAVGESAQSRSYARMNPLTNRERAIIENLKSEINETLNLAVNQAIDFNQIISNALGLYSTNISDGAGGFIRYLHNAPTLEDSTYIVTETAQGFAWTQSGWNGGSPVWSYGVTSGGYALFKWLSAEGIDVTKASSDYRAQVTPEYFNIYYKNDLIITIDATERAIKTPRMVIPYSATSNNMLRIGNAVWLPAPNGANLVVLEG